MENKKKVEKIISTLKKHTKTLPLPLSNIIIQEYGKDSFLILISCLLSLRAKDKITIHVCRNLFAKAKTPTQLLSIPQKKLEKIIFKSGFYKNKAQVLHNVSKIIHEKYNNKVPNSIDDLLKIKGIGRKTANLVLGLAFDKPGICVDVHVHRISNRLGLIKTKSTINSEYELQKIIPRKNWIEWNKLLVMWGQNICTPRTPRCTRCAIKNFCYFYKNI